MWVVDMKCCYVGALVLLITTTVTLAANNSVGIRAYEQGQYAQAIDKLTPAAMQGDAEAQYYLASSLRTQLPLPAGIYKARPSETDASQRVIHEWLEKSANQGYAAAQRELAKDLSDGFGTTVDYQRSLEWMYKAVDAGDEQARTTLVNWYTRGYIVAPDLAKAADMRKFAALSQGADTQTHLDTFKKLLEVTKDYLEKHTAPVQYTDEVLAEAGDPRAAVRLAQKALANKDQKDCDTAAKWYERAGQLGDANGFRAVGEQWYLGDCGAQDFSKARQAYGRGAAVGDSLTLYALAKMELFGHGQAPDYPAAYLHLKSLEIVDPKWMQNEPGPLLFSARQLSEEQRRAADKQLATLEPMLRKARERDDAKETVRPIKSEGDASTLFAYSLTRIDRSVTCAYNYRGACAYVPFDTRLEIRNSEAATLDCKLQLAAKFFPETESKIINRRYIVRPSSTKLPVIGTITGEVDAAATTFTCERIAQPSVAEGTCVLDTPPDANPNKYYPVKALKDHLGGKVTLAISTAAISGKPADVQIEKSSDLPLIDKGAVDFARATTFETNCPGQRLPLSISFRP
jgi:TPR repeat protein